MAPLTRANCAVLYAASFKGQHMVQKITTLLLFLPSICLAIVDDGLPYLHRSSAYYDQQNSLICMAQAFTASESNKVFGIDFVKRRIRPLLLIFENRCTASFTILRSDLEAQNKLELFSSQRIIDELQYNTLAFTASTGLPALWYFWELCLPISAMAYEMYRHNQWASDFISDHILDEITTIGPLQTVKRLIFVHDETDFNQFLLRVHDNRAGSTIIFNVDLMQSIAPLQKQPAEGGLHD